MNLFPKKVSLYLGIIVFLIFVIYFALNASTFKPLLDVNIWLLVLIAIADLTVIMVNGLFIKFILKPFDKYISLIESGRVSLISSVGNFFAPVGAGFGFRAVYLKKKHNLPYSEYLSTLSGNYIIVFLVNSFFALVALYLLRSHHSKQYLVLIGLFSGTFIMSLALSILKIPASLQRKVNNNKRLSKISKPFFQVIDGWNKIVADKSLMVRLISIIFFNILITIAIATLEIHALHFHIGLPQLLLFSVLGSLSLFINLTPANLGVKEAIYIFSRSVIGFSTGQILSIALLDRGVLFIILFISWIIFGRMKKSLDPTLTEAMGSKNEIIVS